MQGATTVVARGMIMIRLRGTKSQHPQNEPSRGYVAAARPAGERPADGHGLMVVGLYIDEEEGD